VVTVDNRSEIREFLASRRARITPSQAGLPAYGTNRRVAGLRREEVAMLAGVSVAYYVRLERGNLSGVSESVLDAVAGALQLDDAERSHLFDLARAVNTTPRKRRMTTNQQVRPGVQRILDAMTGAPAFVRNGRFDVLAVNRLGRALYAPVFDQPGPAGNVSSPNTARFAFLDPRGPEFYGNWERAAHDVVAILHAEAGRNPYDRDLSDLIGELSTRSETFRVLWAEHDVHYHDTGVKHFRHPVVGEITLTYEAMELRADAELTMFAYSAEPGSPSADALNLLASRAATVDQEISADPV
jgi:transcriptional regulator with XRE-family HTH domain